MSSMRVGCWVGAYWFIWIVYACVLLGISSAISTQMWCTWQVYRFIIYRILAANLFIVCLSTNHIQSLREIECEKQKLISTAKQFWFSFKILHFISGFPRKKKRQSVHICCWRMGHRSKWKIPMDGRHWPKQSAMVIDRQVSSSSTTTTTKSFI